MDLVYRFAADDDMDQLWPLVEESWSGTKTRITLKTLQRDLFGITEIESAAATNRCKDQTYIELDPLQAQQTFPVCNVIVAEVDGELVGYLLFHQFYSPWRSRGVYVDQIHVKPTHRRKGIASGFFQKLEEHCRAENLGYLLYDVARLGHVLENALHKYKPNVCRNDETDWSVYRIELDDRDK